MLPEQQQRIMGYFIEEAKDHLNTIEQGLLSLQDTIEDTEKANEVFRAAHSVKGGAAMLGLESIQKTAHRLEDYFKVLKEAPVQVDRAIETMFLRVSDGLKDLLEQLEGPFGLTPDKAQEIMTDVEPVFGQIEARLNTLIEEASEEIGEADGASVYVGMESAGTSPDDFSDRFQREVALLLRQMLTAFKQPDTAESRKNLQDICVQLSSIGEQFELSAWCDLIETARIVAASLDNDYRTLAPILITEIKKSQDLVLSGRASEIFVSDPMQSLLPEDTLFSAGLNAAGLNAAALEDTYLGNGHAGDELDSLGFDIADAGNAEEIAQGLEALSLNADMPMALPGSDEESADLPLEADDDLAGLFESDAEADLFGSDLEEDAKNLSENELEESAPYAAAIAPEADPAVDEIGRLTLDLEFDEIPFELSTLNRHLDGDEKADESLDALLATVNVTGPDVGTEELNSLADLFDGDLDKLDNTLGGHPFVSEEMQLHPENIDRAVEDDITDLLADDATDDTSQEIATADGLEDDLFGGTLTGGEFATVDESDLADSALDAPPLDVSPLNVPSDISADIAALSEDVWADDDLPGAGGLPEPAALTSTIPADLEDRPDLDFPELERPDLSELMLNEPLEEHPESGIETLSSGSIDSNGSALEETSAAAHVAETAQPGPISASFSRRAAAVSRRIGSEFYPLTEAALQQAEQAIDSFFLDDPVSEPGKRSEEADPALASSVLDLSANSPSEEPSEKLSEESEEQLSDGPWGELSIDDSLSDSTPQTASEPASFDFSFEETAIASEVADDIDADQSSFDLDELLEAAEENEDGHELNTISAITSDTVANDDDLTDDLWEDLAALSDVAEKNVSTEDDLDLMAVTDETVDDDSLDLDALFASDRSDASDDPADSLTEEALHTPSEDTPLDDLSDGAMDEADDELTYFSAAIDDAVTDSETDDSEIDDSETDDLDDSETDDLSDFDLLGDDLSEDSVEEVASEEADDSLNDLEPLLLDNGADDSADVSIEDKSVDADSSPTIDLPPAGDAEETVLGIAASGDAEDFGDLERLLEEGADKGPVPMPSRLMPPRLMPPRPTRRSGGLREQNMRVSVNHLDNLSNLVGELVVSRNTLERDQERLRQFLDNLLFQVQQLNDVGQRIRDLYERSLLESSLLSNRRAHSSLNNGKEPPAEASHATGATFDALEMDRFTGFHTLSQEMIELIVRVRESASDIGYTVESSDQVTRQFRQITTQLQEGLNTARMVAFSQAADRLPRAVRDISLKCGKEAQLVVEGQDTLIDKMIVENLYDPLTHLVNNAITHGIEIPAERTTAGKSAEGLITVRAFYQGNQTVIYVADDGGGIDTELVKRKAIEQKLIGSEAAAALSDIETYELLFHPGFSTRDQADDFAGRGVGMDVVRTSLAEIRGSITIDSETGKGTSFTIRLPLTLSISKALSCVSNQARIAFPMDGVEDMLDVPRDRIIKNDQDQDCVRWRDTLLPFQPVTDLLKFNRTLGRGRVYGGGQDEDVLSIIVLRNANTFVAVQVDQVIGEQEIVIKQLEGPVPKPLGIAGATVLGDGRVMPIADVLELIDIAMGRIRREPASLMWAQDVVEPPVKSDPTVLIVDDSITVRELLSMSFNKIGYRVEQARDGQEAWDKLRSGLPCDLVFCDIEMPRMDGLELLSRLQKDSQLKRIPIAMLTSRGADRHRQMAVDLGASGYFTKPYLEEALLDAAQRMLNGETLAKGRGG